jgi:ribonuclease VapC
VIIDTSAVVAVLLAEPDSAELVARIAHAEHTAISAVNWFEAGILLDHRGDATARNGFEEFFQHFGIEVVSVTPELAALARSAYRSWGKGNHPARLNFADCFSYALAKQRGQPLLFKGDDFSRTDIAAVSRSES